MKLASETSVVERSGEFTQSAFSIEMNSKAFYVLSAQLYSNKIQAVIRELSTNAHDAQIFSKTKQPFEVHLPTMWEPEFSVRDYGPGLSEDDVKNLYTTYFKSNKINSNDFVGCLGLGSKSPFAYTDSFTVTSWFGGECKQYTMYLDEQKFPQCALLTCNPSKEATGLKVSLSVKNNEINTFLKEAKRVFSFFKDKPKMTGANVSLIDIKGSMEGTGWKFGITTEFGSHAFAVMGNIAYPILNAATHLPAHLKPLCSAPVAIYVDIGDIEPSPNREELSYNKATIKAITDKLELVSAEFLKNVKAKVALATSLWDARMKYAELHKSGAFNYVDGKQVLWNGQRVDSTSVSFPTKEFTLTLYRMRGATKMEKTNQQTISMDNEDQFYWLDDDKARKNFLHHVKSQRGGSYSWSYSKNVYLIEPGEWTDPKTQLSVKASTTKADFEKQLGKPILDISSLPKAPVVARAPKDKYKMLVSDLKKKTTSTLEDSINDGEYYLYLNRNSDLAPGDTYTSHWTSQNNLYGLIEQWNKLHPTKQIKERVLLLKHHQDQKKVSKYKLVNVFTFMKDEVEAFIKQGNNKNLLENYNYYAHAGYNNVQEANMFSLITDENFTKFKSPNLSSLAKEVAEYNTVGQHAKFISQWFSGSVSTTKKPNINFQPILAEYPMLTLIFDRYNNFKTWDVKEKKIVLDYVQ